MPADGPLPGKNPRLPPTPSLSEYELEDFTERLLSASRFCSGSARRVTRVERWGRRGDFQDGVDFEGEYSDGKTAAWQCKRYDKLTPAHVREVVRVCTFQADEYYLVFSGEASRDARMEIKKHSKWQLLDQRALGRMLDDLPLHKRRDVLDATWDRPTRQFLLGVPGTDAFLSLDTFVADRMKEDAPLNDRGPRIGRDAELAALRTALDRSADFPTVVVVAGPGGRGKTRLLTEALAEFEQAHPQVPVVCLSPGRSLDQAAIDELPLTPAVVLVDDAHRDPAALAALLTYARLTEGTQVVLGSRTSGVAAVQAEIINARFAPAQVETIPVGELSRRDARKLVTSIADGLDLTLAAQEYFAGQAVDSPHVAVIGVNLIRSGRLTAPLKADNALRQQVLARYQEVATGELEGVPNRTVRRTLAVFAALGPIDDTDDTLRTDIARFVELDMGDLLRLCRSLHDRGVLVTRGGLTRVVPDVLADEILETSAAVGRHATNFAQQLWEAFGNPSDDRLVTTLAELDWRLGQRDGPSVIGPIWESVADWLRGAEPVELHRALRGLRNLATTLPVPFLTVLEELRVRLQEQDRTVDDAAAAHPFFGRAESSRDVLWLMPEMYGQCAANAPETLETVLDALWSLYLDDSQPPNQYPGHVVRVIEDRLTSIGDLPDPSFPLRIVAWVDKQLAQASDLRHATPMFALRPLLAKDGTRTVAETRRRISLRPYAVSVTWARPIRDAIRSTLLRQASGTDLRRAGEAVRLLGTAVRQPTGPPNRNVTTEEVVGWEEDDLATVTTVETAAVSTGSAVIRRLIRHEIGWTAEHARSVRVRHAALSLVTSLDNRDDDLAEVLLSTFRGFPTRRGMMVATLDELRAAEAARAAREAGMPQDEIDAEHSEQRRVRIEERTAMHERAVAQVVTRLTSDSIPELVRTLRISAVEVELAAPRPPTLWALWREFAKQRSDLIPHVVRKIADGPASVLDQSLHQLLDAWADYDATGLLAWLADASSYRTDVRLAIGTAFATYTWTDRGAPFEQIHREGIAEAEPELRDRFIMGSHKLLATAPAATARLLLSEQPSPHALTSALQSACGYDGLSWGQTQSDEDASAILDLINHADWNDYTVQQIVAGIALTYPRLVLDHLENLHGDGGRLPTDVDGFADAFDRNAEALTHWVVDRAHNGKAANASIVISIAMKGGMTTAQAQHLATAVDELDDAALEDTVSALRDVSAWPLRHPDLARTILVRARLLNGNMATRVLADISGAMTLHSWGFSNGVSDELNNARAAAAQAAATETNPDLKAAFTAAELWAAVHAEQLLAEADDNDD
ncbi:restriction endonuclease [Micromonospora sp. WMMD882]|nr:restriction endonuclease [Micromonospora sp. WMMD882]WBB82127.1 restriction endonuclease [Micromonospora sp. WMMD882]